MYLDIEDASKPQVILLQFISLLAAIFFELLVYINILELIEVGTLSCLFDTIINNYDIVLYLPGTLQKLRIFFRFEVLITTLILIIYLQDRTIILNLLSRLFLIWLCIIYITLLTIN